MSETVRPPAECKSMSEVRRGVDFLDERIVALLGERFRYMAAAARIKATKAEVRDEARKAEVIANAARVALEESIPRDIIVDLYDRLVEASIGFELDLFDRRQPAASITSPVNNRM